ncbi:PREDICTED: uncharacterized protein LOC109151407 [Ipomoea nil]|uniref:uncharacterized protein LOC109151407 n=1 Tax=Ipomoea nil TaxID=35883 RepID=UPI0009010DA6|nr:PREDICTED: uncharacterized protein LOC109151407 [Ipomoea nil]
MERHSIKLLLLLAFFMVASLLPSIMMAQVSVGPNKKQLFMTGQLCKSHDDCKANSVYSTNFCINEISGSEIGHCVGFDSTLEMVVKKSKAKEGGCGKCETDDDCKNCPAAASCEKYIMNGTCV